MAEVETVKLVIRVSQTKNSNFRDLWAAPKALLKFSISRNLQSTKVPINLIFKNKDKYSFHLNLIQREEDIKTILRAKTHGSVQSDTPKNMKIRQFSETKKALNYE